ncbi:MAG TPA: AraC family transcriptional regulator [Acidobacteria bacterium]|nr:AraC family transcriptional regulator [Acidobacteriota bacterium]
MRREHEHRTATRGAPRDASIPLVRAGLVEPLLWEARSIGVPVDRLMERVGIPCSVEEDPFLVVPALPVWRFGAVVERRDAGPLFGFRAVMKMPFTRITSLRPLLRGCLNLKELLLRLCAVVRTQSNTSVYRLREEHDVVWLENAGPALLPECASGSLYEIVGMIHLVRLAAGAEWRPRAIALSCPWRPELETVPELGSGRIHFSRPARSIAVPRHLLPLPVTTPDEAAPLRHDPDDLQALTGLSSELLRTLPAYLPERGPTIRRLATALGISVRTLQRRLDLLGTSWTRILERARFLRAQELLRDTDLKAAEIAMEVGYSHASSFCRSFRKLAGVSPSEYRRHFGQAHHENQP